MTSLVVDNGIIVTMDSQRRVIRGTIVTKDGMITRIVEGKDAFSRSKADEVIDATGKIVIPGLVNSHVHPIGTLLRGLADEMTLPEQLKDTLFISQLNNVAGAHYATLLTLIECLKSGTTFACLDMYTDSCRPIESIHDIGMKGAVTTDPVGSYAENWEYFLRDEDTSIALASQHYQKCRELGIVPLIEAPPEEHFGEKILRQTKMVCDRFNMKAHMHLAENLHRVNLCQSSFGLSPVRYLKKVGFLGEHMMGVHGVWLDREEVEIYAKSRCSLVTTPVAEAKLGDGVAPLDTYLEKGVLVGLGTDGGLWNNCNDLFREMKALCLIHKARVSASFMTATQALELATINGAKMFGLDDRIGSIEIGKEADLVIVDTYKPHMRPLILGSRSNVISNLVYCATGSDVESVVVKGKVLVQNRQLRTVDEGEVIERCQHVAESFVDKWQTTQRSTV